MNYYTITAFILYLVAMLGIGFLFVLGRGLDEESKNLLDSYKCEGAE